MNEDESGNEIKTILVGMSGTGKTNIINALTGKPFNTTLFSTTTSTFVDKIMEVNHKKHRVEIWDTAGQERYRSLTKMFINDSKIVIFVYDITDKKSFEEVDFWVKTVKEILGDNPIFGLAGNKKDLFQNEQVEEEEGQKKAEEIGAIFKLTSAKTGVGINDFMQKLLEEYIEKRGPKEEIKNENENTKKIDDNTKSQRLVSCVDYNKQGKKKKKCC